MKSRLFAPFLILIISLVTALCSIGCIAESEPTEQAAAEVLDQGVQPESQVDQSVQSESASAGVPVCPVGYHGCVCAGGAWSGCAKNGVSCANFCQDF